MKITLRELEVLNAVVTAGSISKAGKSLKLSQPTISQKVAKLEEELGTQLLHRGGARNIRLTAAGEFWYKSAVELLSSFEKTVKTHETMFGSSNFSLTFATTHALQRFFSLSAAQTALAQEDFKRIEALGFETPDKVIQAITTHNVNCGIVHINDHEERFGSFHVEHLFTDRLLWIVPANVPDQTLHDLVSIGFELSKPHPSIDQFISVLVDPSLHKINVNWYRQNLPYARPILECTSYDVVIDLVRSGAGTALVPLSYLSLLTEAERAGIKAVEIDLHYQDVKFVMQRHLLSTRPFANFCRTFCDGVRRYNRSIALSGSVFHRRAS